MPTADGLDTNESTVGRTSGNRGARGHGGLSRSAIVLQRRGESQNFLSFSFWKENDRIKSGLRPSSETDRQGVDIDKRGAVKRRRVHTKPSMLATRPKLGNGNLQELNDEAKATRPPLCFCLALDRSGPSQPAADGASAQFPSPSFVSAHRRPLAPP